VIAQLLDAPAAHDPERGARPVGEGIEGITARGLQPNRVGLLLVVHEHPVETEQEQQPVVGMPVDVPEDLLHGLPAGIRLQIPASVFQSQSACHFRPARPASFTRLYGTIE
jgi:hypothetical protein